MLWLVQNFLGHYGWIIFHCVDGLHLPPRGRTTSSLSLHPPWTLGSLHPPAIVSNAAMSLGVQIPAFDSFGQIARGGIAGPHGGAVFSLRRSYRTALYRLPRRTLRAPAARLEHPLACLLGSCCPQGHEVLLQWF